MRRSLIAVPVFALASFALAACGDDEKSSSGGGRAATAVKGDAFCVKATEVDGLIANMAMAFGDSAATETALKALVDGATQAEALAPTDIADEVTVSVQGFRDLAAGLEKFDWDLEAASADPDFLALMEGTEADAASARLETYLLEKCGIASS